MVSDLGMGLRAGRLLSLYPFHPVHEAVLSRTELAIPETAAHERAKYIMYLRITQKQKNFSKSSSKETEMTSIKGVLK